MNTYELPMFLSSTMENSNNAVDNVPMFCDVRQTEGIFKLPISELSFNGTIKHVQKLQPIVDPITALTCANAAATCKSLTLNRNSKDYSISHLNVSDCTFNNTLSIEQKICTEENSDLRSSSTEKMSDTSPERSRVENPTESTGDSQYDETSKNEYQNYIPFEESYIDDSSMKWNIEQSHSSVEVSFDSGVRSPDMFSDEFDEPPPILEPEPEPFWNFVKDYEAYDKSRLKKFEKILQGVPPPPSVTDFNMDAAEILKRCNAFFGNDNNEVKITTEALETPTKRVSYANVSELCSTSTTLLETNDTHHSFTSSNYIDTSFDKSKVPKKCTEYECINTQWPNVLKCQYYDVHYNLSSYSERLEVVAQRYSERYVSNETASTVCIYSNGMQSPSSIEKRKAQRLRMAQAKSPGRRLSHLARRRQVLCSAATIREQSQVSTSKMVLIDKKYCSLFPHRKLVSTEKISPKKTRTPGKKTPGKKTPPKKTPAKTPKSGGSSRKKAMRRLLIDPESTTCSQRSRQPLKRALFLSPEHKGNIPMASTSSAPVLTMKLRRNLFGSPTETKSMDGTRSEHFLKRKRDALGDVPETNRSKVAKSLSFGGDTVESSKQVEINRRASEAAPTKTFAPLNESHKKKLLWAVTEALRVHGWRMSTPGFREKATILARLTRRLLTLTPHAARYASANLSTSDTLLKLAKKYSFAIIQGRTADDCYEEEQTLIANMPVKLTGYISSSAYEQLKNKQTLASFQLSQIKENTCNSVTVKPEQPKSNSKNVLQDKLVNMDANSNSSSSYSFDRSASYRSTSMPSFEEAAKMRARRQISFDNLDFPRR